MYKAVSYYISGAGSYMSRSSSYRQLLDRLIKLNPCRRLKTRSGPATVYAGLIFSRPFVLRKYNNNNGKSVDARGLHSLSCHKSSPRQQRDSSMNDILLTAVKRAQIPATINKGTGEFYSAKWETHRWQHIDPIIQRQVSGPGCHCPRHLCRITHW